MKYSELAQLKINPAEKSKYDKIFKVDFKPSKITYNYITLVFLDLLVHDGEAYAAQAKEIFDDVLPQPGFISLSNGNLYPVIKELKEKKYIKETGKSENNAKYYKITEEGRKAHKELKDSLKTEINNSIKFYKAIKKMIYKK